MADINFDCPLCGQNMDAPEEMAGMDIGCPSCEHGITIPKSSGQTANPVEEDASGAEGAKPA